MKFYTYVAKIGNRIYRREIDNKGERYSGYTHFKPTLYLPAPEDKSNYRSLDNEPLGSHTFDSMKGVRSSHCSINSKSDRFDSDSLTFF